MEEALDYTDLNLAADCDIVVEAAVEDVHTRKKEA